MCRLTGQGFNNFLPIIIEDGLGFSSVQAQYLVIPGMHSPRSGSIVELTALIAVQMWGAIIYMAVAWLSDRLQRRFIFVMIFGSITALGYVLILCPIPAGAQYFSTFLITTGMYIMAGINLSWTSLNSAPDGKRGATMGITLTLTDLAGMIYNFSSFRFQD